MGLLLPTFSRRRVLTHRLTTHLDLWLICWHLHQVGLDTRRPPLVSHNWPSVNTVTAGGPGHPWAPRFDIVRAYPLRPLAGNYTVPAAPAKRKSLHLDSLKLLVIAFWGHSASFSKFLWGLVLKSAHALRHFVHRRYRRASPSNKAPPFYVLWPHCRSVMHM